MFKWLKKVMISIINAIQSLFVGDKEVQSVSIGNTQVYPNYGGDDPTQWPSGFDGKVRKIKSIEVAYFSDSSAQTSDPTITSIGAIGSNNGNAIFCCLYAVYDLYAAYTNNLLESDQWMYCPVDQSTLPDWLHVDGYRIYADRREATPSGQRTANISCVELPAPATSSTPATFQLKSGVSISGKTVTQLGNVPILDHSEITSIKYFGTSSPLRITDYNTSDNLTVVCTDKVGTYHYTLSTGDPYTAPISSWGANSNQSWATIESGTCNVILAPYTGAAGGSRTVTISVFPTSDATNQYAYTITQGMEYYLVFASGSSSTKTISYSTTTGTIQVVSSHNGSAYSVSATSSGSWLSIGTIYNSGSTYTIPFSCSANSSSSDRSSTITITQSGGLSLTCTVTQEQNNTALEGVTVAPSGQTETANWVIGTIQETGGKKSLVIVRKSDWQYSGQSGNVSYSGLMWSGNTSGESYSNLYIANNSRVTSSYTGKSYIGAYVKSTSGTDLKNQTNGDIYYVTSFTE